MAGLTQPLEFKKGMQCAPQAGFDFVPFLDAILIALFVALNTSPFIIAPGAAIELSNSATQFARSSAPTAVLTVGRNELYFFEGAKLSRLTLQDHLREYVKASGPGDPVPTLLIKADASLSTNLLFQLMDMARSAGFTQVHLAAEFPQRPGEFDQGGESGGGEP